MNGRTTVRAAGAVLWRHAGGRSGIEVALVHRPRYDDWSLPKGKLDPGETSPAAAVREVAEETGASATLGRGLGTVEYPLAGTRTKRVEYFAARACRGEFVPNGEVDELRWLHPTDASGLVGYPGDRRILATFRELPAELSTMLLVRHAKAGTREDWNGPDELRPLSSSGKEQAAALHLLLPLFGATAVHSAPRVRCEHTVSAVANDLTVRIAMEPRLSEEGYWPDPDAGLARLKEIASGTGVPIVCSQGGVIPDIIGRLAEGTQVRLGDVRSKKGSLWVLSLTVSPQRPALVAADYYPSPLPEPH